MQVNSGRDTDRSETAAATSQMSQHATAAAAAAAAVDNNWPARHPHAPVQSAGRWDRQSDRQTDGQTDTGPLHHTHTPQCRVLV